MAKIATIINPYYMNKPNRLKLRERYIEPYLSMGDGLRYNGNGRSNSEVSQIEENVDKIVIYTSQKNFNHPSVAPEAPLNVIQRAKQIAIKALGEKRVSSMSPREQQYVLDSVHSIYGYGSTPSSIIFIYTGKNTHHEFDKWLYSAAIAIAKASGIKIVFIKPDAVLKKEATDEINTIEKESTG